MDNYEIEHVRADLRDDKKYIATENQVSTSAAYFALPLDKRTRPHWLWRRSYLLPGGLAMNVDELDGSLPICSEWDEFFRRIHHDFPIQSFFRETVSRWFDFRRRSIKDRYYNIRNWMFPRQRWLYKGIPNHWQDKTSLSVDILYRMVVHFIEGEDALNVIDWESDPEHLEFRQGLVECYKWIKAGRSELMAQMENEMDVGVPSRRHLYSKETQPIATYTAIYGPYNELEVRLENTDTEMCVWIIQNRKYLWT
jgi:hypothetical protein